MKEKLIEILESKNFQQVKHEELEKYIKKENYHFAELVPFSQEITDLFNEAALVKCILFFFYKNIIPDNELAMHQITIDSMFTSSIRNVQALQFFFEAGAKINNDKCENQQRERVLHDAIQYGSLESVLFLLQQKADSNIEGWSSLSPLYLATYHNKHKIMRMLIEHHADVNIHYPPRNNDTPLTALIAFVEDKSKSTKSIDNIATSFRILVDASAIIYPDHLSMLRKDLNPPITSQLLKLFTEHLESAQLTVEEGASSAAAASSVEIEVLPSGDVAEPHWLNSCLVG